MPPPNDNDADSFLAEIGSAKVDTRDRQIAELQEELTAERDARREDRFFFIFTIVIFLDVMFFTLFDNFGGPIALLVLQLLFLVLLAKRLGMEESVAIFDRVIGRVADGMGRGSDGQ